MGEIQDDNKFDQFDFLVKCCLCSLKRKALFEFEKEKELINECFPELFNLAILHRILPTFNDFLEYYPDILYSKNKTLIKEHNKGLLFNDLLRTVELIQVNKSLFQNGFDFKKWFAFGYWNLLPPQLIKKGQ